MATNQILVTHLLLQIYSYIYIYIYLCNNTYSYIYTVYILLHWSVAYEEQDAIFLRQFTEGIGNSVAIRSVHDTLRKRCFLTEYVLYVIIDDKNSWKSHIKHVQTKVSWSSIAVFNKAKLVLDHKSLRILHSSYISITVQKSGAMITQVQYIQCVFFKTRQ